MKSSSYSPYRSTGGQAPHVDRLVTTLFRDLATNESLVSFHTIFPMRHNLRMQTLTKHSLRYEFDTMVQSWLP